MRYQPIRPMSQDASCRSIPAPNFAARNSADGLVRNPICRASESAANFGRGSGMSSHKSQAFELKPVLSFEWAPELEEGRSGRLDWRKDRVGAWTGGRAERAPGLEGGRSGRLDWKSIGRG